MGLKKQIIPCTVLIIILMLVSGCSEMASTKIDDKLLGAWNSNDRYMRTLIFFPDGTWSAGETTGSWAIKNEQLEIQRNSDKGTFTYVYYFENNYNRLILEDVFSQAQYTYSKI